MNIQTSIALHLARVMGIETWVVRFAPRSEPITKLHFTRDGETHEWNPHDDLSQWAECVLWAAGNGLEPCILGTVASAWSHTERKEISTDCLCTSSSIQAATLEAIALATGWEESK